MNHGAIVPTLATREYDCSHMGKNVFRELDTIPQTGVPVIAGIRPVLRHLACGAFLFRQGDKTVGMFLLESGRLSMQRITPDGSRVTLHVVRPGELFAEPALFSERYHCDMFAETDAEVWFYPKKELVASLHENPESLWAFADRLARGLQGMRLRYELKQIRSAPDRVMQLLRLRCDDAGVYAVAGTLKELAAELGLTHEALYRAISTLEKRGRISRETGQLRILPGTGS